MVALTIAAGVNRWFTPLPEASQSDASGGVHGR